MTYSAVAGVKGTLEVYGETYDYTWTLSAGTYDFKGDVVLYQQNSASQFGFDCGANSPTVIVEGNIWKEARVIPPSVEDGSTRWIGDIILGGNSNQTVDIDVLAEQPSITIAKTGGTVTLLSTVSNDTFNVTGGTVDFNGQTVKTTDDFSIGTNAHVNASGLNGASIEVGGNLNLAGEPGDLLALRATAPWALSVAGEATAAYVDVAYSDASGGSTIMVTDTASRNGGNNIFWHFKGGTLLVFY